MDPESMLKGRMAETLVEELFKNSGNTIYRFGYEAILQNLTQIERSFNGENETEKRIRAIPDFIVIDSNDNPTFLEVKYRNDGKLHANDHERLNRIKKFWDAKIIFVNCASKPYFKISAPPYYDEKGTFISKPLSEEKLWKIDPEAYKKSEYLVEKYLANTLITK